MNYFLALTLVTLAVVVQSETNNRAKRFAGFGAFSAAGGRIGCVVSENGPNNASLFINSHFTKYLSEEEMQELEQYKEKLTAFKSDVKAFLEQRQKQAVERRDQLRQGGFGPGSQRGGPTDGVAQAQSSDSDANQTTQPSGPLRQPEPPKKPSFCNDKATTQFVFDGCSVQGDSVYIGDSFVRKLSAQEQDELEQFDKQFSAYQKQVTSNFRSQVEDIFGKHFGQLFGASGSSKSQDGSVPVEASSEAPVTAVAPLEPPKTPNFCTLII